jgi:hypothetical protein
MKKRGLFHITRDYSTYENTEIDGTDKVDMPQRGVVAIRISSGL